MNSVSVGELLGGLALFFYGLHKVREGLQLVAGDRLRTVLLRLTDNRFKAFGFGAFITMILQSSSATSALLVGLAGGGLLTLRQAFAVILGADVGTTAVVFLLAAHGVSGYAMLAIALGITLYLGARRQVWRYSGQILFGVGFVFHGLMLTVQAMSPMKDNATVQTALMVLAVNPFWAVVGSAIFTALVRSSAATLGLALSLAYSGILTLEHAIPFVLGANLGTTITAALAALGNDVSAKRVAGAHCISKFTGVILAYPFMHYAVVGLTYVSALLEDWDTPFGGGLGLQVALAHFFFNLGVAILFLPFLPLGVKLVTWLIVDTPQPDRYGPRYLDEKSLEAPILALSQAAREILRIAGLARELFSQGLRLFERGPEFYRVVEEVEGIDDKIDVLERGVRFFLAKMSHESLTDVQVRTQMRLLRLASLFEEIGDTVSKEMTHLGRKRYDRQRFFSDEGWEELCSFHVKALELFTVTLGCLTTPDPALIKDAEGRSRMLVGLEEELRMAHLRRLHEGVRESLETSSIHLDLLGDIRQVAQKLGQIAKLVEEERGTL